MSTTTLSVSHGGDAGDRPEAVPCLALALQYDRLGGPFARWAFGRSIRF